MKKTNIINEHQIIKDVMLGNNVTIYNFVNLYGCSIGDNSKIGTFVEIQKNVHIGKNCKIQSHTFICEGVEIKNNVFIGHNVSFINDKYPKAVNDEGALQTESDWTVEKTFIGDNVTIGTSATMLSGITIGENSIVGAGSVVTKDVPANTIAAGNPAVFMRSVK